MTLLAFDARVLVRPTTGVGRVTHDLLMHLAPLRDRGVVLTRPGAQLPPLPSGWISASVHPSGLRFQLSAARVLSRYGVDVSFSPVTAFPLRPRLPGVSTVHDLAWADPRTGGDRRGALAMNWWLRKARRRNLTLIVGAEAVREALTRRNPDHAGHVHVVPWGVDADFWGGAGSPSDLPAGLPPSFVLTVGIAPRKDVPKVLQAAAGTGLGVVVVGGSEARWKEIVSARPSLATTSDVRFLGTVPDPVLRALYRRAAVLVSLSREEGFNLPLIEAMAAGTPVVASDIAVHREVTGGHATLVSADEPDEVRTAMLHAKGSGDGSTAAVAWARTFTWRRAAAHVDTILRSIEASG
jgi:glycosyltransferase involved in cell wall biosynthesis